MTRYYPEDWSAQRDAFVAWLEDASALAALWTNQDAPRLDKPYISVGVVTPPISVGQAVESNSRGVRVLLTQSSTSYTILINDAPYTFVSDASATTSEVRDGLIAVINGALPGAASVGTSDTLAIALSATSTLEVLNETLLGVKILQIYTGEAELVLSVEVFGDVEDDTQIAADALKLDVETSSARETLNSVGLAFIGPVGSRRLSMVVNGLWEHRVGFDMRLRTLTRRVEVIDLIARVVEGGVAGVFSV